MKLTINLEATVLNDSLRKVRNDDLELIDHDESVGKFFSEVFKVFA